MHLCHFCSNYKKCFHIYYEFWLCRLLYIFYLLFSYVIFNFQFSPSLFCINLFVISKFYIHKLLRIKTIKLQFFKTKILINNNLFQNEYLLRLSISEFFFQRYLVFNTGTSSLHQFDTDQRNKIRFNPETFLKIN